MMQRRAERPSALAASPWLCLLSMLMSRAEAFSVSQINNKPHQHNRNHRRNPRSPTLSSTVGGQQQRAFSANSPSSSSLRAHTNAYLESLSLLQTTTVVRETSATSAYLNSLSELASVNDYDTSFYNTAGEGYEYVNSPPPTAVVDPQTYLEQVAQFAASSPTTIIAEEPQQVQQLQQQPPPTMMDTTMMNDAANSAATTAFNNNNNDASNFLQAQLGDLSYDSMADGSTSGGGGDTPGGNLQQFLPNLDQLAHARDGAAHQVGRVWGQVAHAGREVATRVGSTSDRAIQGMSVGMDKSSTTLAQTPVGQAISRETGQWSQQSNQAMKSLTDSSLADLAQGVVNGLGYIGKTLVMGMDSFLTTLQGPTVATLVARSQTSIEGLLAGARESVAATIQACGEITLAQAAQALWALFVAVVKVLYALVNALVKLLSNNGPGISDYALAASNNINTQLNQVASSTQDFVTTKTLGEMGSDVTELSQSLGGQFSELLAEVTQQISSTAAGGAASAGGFMISSAAETATSSGMWPPPPFL